VKLSESKLVSTVDDDGIGAGDINPGLDDGGTQQEIESLLIEVSHHVLKLTLSHLTVSDMNTRLRQ
jgi:hypothetical protein